ncbi:MAG: hydroxyisourate hydrolase [Actinomycetes bacterium]
MSFITAHVLDAVDGVPARGVEVQLSNAAGDRLGDALTDDDGRVRDLGPKSLPPGQYRVWFATGAYFAGRNRDTFYPSVSVDFTVTAGQAHYHVPLLLSPFAYSTYRGS